MKYEKYFFFIFGASVLIFFILIFSIYSSIKELTIKEQNESQRIYAKQASYGIQEYIYGVASTLELLSKSDDIIQMSPEGKRTLGDYQKIKSEKIKGISRVNSNGKIIYTFPSKQSVGEDISAQEHFQLSVSTKKLVISDVFQAVQGFRTIAVHVPVFKDGIYDGTLAALLSYDKIASMYVENIRIGENGSAWVMSAKGIILSSLEKDTIAKHYEEAFRSLPEKKAIAQKMVQGKAGESFYYDQHPSDSSGKILKHSVYMPVQIGNSFWAIAVATPESQILSSIWGLRTRMIIVTVILFALCLLFLYFIVRFRIIQNERRRRENVSKALFKSEERYRNLLFQISDGFVAFDKSMNYTYVNQKAGEFLGKKPEDLIGKNYWKEYPEAKGTPFADAYVRAFEKQETIIFEDYYQPWNRWFENRIYPFPEGLGVFFTEITERKLLEKEITTLNKDLEERVKDRTRLLEIANKELESFSYSVSHDLRAPLRAIKGFSEIINRRYRNEMKEETSHYFDNIIQASGTMELLIDDLLNYSRIGKSAVQCDTVSMNQLLQSLKNTFSEQLKRNGGKIEIPENIPDIYSDKSLLFQIFTNLIDNALKFTKSGVKPIVKIDCHTDENNIYFQISDNGIGVPVEHHEKIFQIFQRLHNQDDYPGTGIGLASVKKSLTLLGGSIMLASEPDKGSTFSIRLPKTDKQNKSGK